MGLLGKSSTEKKKEQLELEEAKIFEDNYGITKLSFEGLTKGLRCAYSTDNIDAIIRLKAPFFYDTVNDIFKASMHNKEQIDKLEKKLDLLLDAVNKQNEFLSMIMNNKITNDKMVKPKI